MPPSPVSIIDFHGSLDSVIPMSLDTPDILGPGPDDTVENSDGYYYHIKQDHLDKVLASMNCELTSTSYPTVMDGVDGWGCVRWSGCDQGREVVHCNASYGHDYPFGDQRIEAIKIIWEFMKANPKVKS